MVVHKARFHHVVHEQRKLPSNSFMFDNVPYLISLIAPELWEVTERMGGKRLGWWYPVSFEFGIANGASLSKTYQYSGETDLENRALVDFDWSVAQLPKPPVSGWAISIPKGLTFRNTSDWGTFQPTYHKPEHTCAAVNVSFMHRNMRCKTCDKDMNEVNSKKFEERDWP